MSRPRQIIFLLFPGVHLQDLAGPAQVFYEAGQLGRHAFNIIYTSPFPKIRSEQQLIFTSLIRPEKIEVHDDDLICIPGVDFASFEQGHIDAAITDIKPWITAQRKRGVAIASICSGALILGKLGLLDRIQCTTHWKCLGYMKKQFPKARVLDHRLYVFDHGIYTSAGVTAGIDMALALIEQWHNPLLAAKVAQEMVINVRRAETHDQKNTFLNFKNRFHEDVYRAQEILANHLKVTYGVENLAADLNMSSRHLSRLFKVHTGQTIQAYRDQLRMAHGEQLLLNASLSIKEIAVACGFENARQFTRVWNKQKGVTPAAFRQSTMGSRQS